MRLDRKNGRPIDVLITVFMAVICFYLLRGFLEAAHESHEWKRKESTNGLAVYSADSRDSRADLPGECFTDDLWLFSVSVCASQTARSLSENPK